MLPEYTSSPTSAYTINIIIDKIKSCRKKTISKRKSELMEQRVNDCEGDQIKNVFSNTLHSLIGSKKIRVLPEYTSSHTSASTINISIDKINTIKIEVSLLEACLPVYSFDDIDLHHILAALKRYFPASFVAPLPNSEQINLPSSNHTYTMSTPKHIHHHYASFVTSTDHLFNCTHIRTTWSPRDLWTYNAGVVELLARWRDKLAGGPKAG